MSPNNLVFFGFAALWIGAWVAASIVFRLNRGKPIFPKAPEQSLFFEGWASGRSLKTPWARIGGAQNCLMFAVTKDNLIVTPRFPFNLLFLPEIYGLEITAPRSRVRIENRASGLFRTGVIVLVDCPDAVRMELKVRDRARFLVALSVG